MPVAMVLVPEIIRAAQTKHRVKLKCLHFQVLDSYCRSIKAISKYKWQKPAQQADSNKQLPMVVTCCWQASSCAWQHRFVTLHEGASGSRLKLIFKNKIHDLLRDSQAADWACEHGPHVLQSSGSHRTVARSAHWCAPGEVCISLYVYTCVFMYYVYAESEHTYVCFRVPNGQPRETCL